MESKSKMESPLWTRRFEGQVTPCSRVFKNQTFQKIEKSTVDALTSLEPACTQSNNTYIHKAFALRPSEVDEKTLY